MSRLDDLARIHEALRAAEAVGDPSSLATGPRTWNTLMTDWLGSDA